MQEKILIAGSGGQGIMLLGKVIAQAGLEAGKHVTWLPSYGAEVRGGAAFCMVIVSDSPIGSPYIDKADTLIAMNGVSLAKYLPRVKPGGLVIINESLAGVQPPGLKARAFGMALTDLAVRLGNIRAANMVALGAYCCLGKSVRLETAKKVILDIFSRAEKTAEVNKNALSEGYNQAAKKKGKE